LIESKDERYIPINYSAARYRSRRWRLLDWRQMLSVALVSRKGKGSQHIFVRAIDA